MYLLVAVVALLPRAAQAQTCYECGGGDDPCAPPTPATWCGCIDDWASCDTGNAGYNGGTGGGAINSSGGPPGGTVAVPTPGSNPGNRIPGPLTTYVTQYTPTAAAGGVLQRDISLAMQAGHVVERDASGTAIAYVQGRGLPRGAGLDRAPSVGTVKGTDPIANNGEFLVDDTDVTLPGYGVPFTFTRHYRSGVDYQTSLGYGWNHDYARRIVPVTTLFPGHPSACSPAVADVVYVDARMNRIRFVFASTSSDKNVDTYLPASPTDLQLTFDHQASSWTLVDRSHTISQFDGKSGVLRSTSRPGDDHHSLRNRRRRADRR